MLVLHEARSLQLHSHEQLIFILYAALQHRPTQCRTNKEPKTQNTTVQLRPITTTTTANSTSKPETNNNFVVDKDCAMWCRRALSHYSFYCCRGSCRKNLDAVYAARRALYVVAFRRPTRSTHVSRNLWLLLLLCASLLFLYLFLFLILLFLFLLLLAVLVAIMVVAAGAGAGAEAVGVAAATGLARVMAMAMTLLHIIWVRSAAFCGRRQ